MQLQMAGSMKKSWVLSYSIDIIKFFSKVTKNQKI